MARGGDAPLTVLSTNDSMSANTTRSQNGSAPDFRDTDGPRAISEESISQMNQPDVEPAEGEVRCYAVARVNGVIDYNDDELGFATGATVLYMDADAQVAFERRYYVDADEWGDIDAVDTAAVDAHPEPTVAMVSHFGDVVARHQEVSA
ncbi:hypothetical protein BJ1_gp07 [Halorubrum virus BJ1]|uniref:Uncharacterized protein n=1 Tax=Halorubrum virus BJ1 TaxID=416419 RepID=A0ZYM0_9CAUD|nr:hypothetical protein BJ1_gp07 [Halorubrum virus BJ1]CAL92429.1 hypothetical protein [Halorubrum virus BJ1]